jgi:hypothetical protein
LCVFFRAPLPTPLITPLPTPLSFLNFSAALVLVWDQGLATRFLSSSVRQLAQSVPVYPCTLAASSSLSWPLVPFPAQPDWMLTAHRCTRPHSLHPPPWPGHSCLHCSLTVYPCASAHSPPPPPWPGH